MSKCEHCGTRRQMCCNGRAAAEARVAALEAALRKIEHMSRNCGEYTMNGTLMDEAYVTENVQAIAYQALAAAPQAALPGKGTT